MFSEKRRSNRLSMSFQKAGQRLSAGINKLLGPVSASYQDGEMVAVPGGQRRSARYNENLPLDPVNKSSTRASLRLGAAFDLASAAGGERRMSIKEHMMEVSSIAGDKFAKLRNLKVGAEPQQQTTEPGIDLDQYLRMDLQELVQKMMHSEMQSPGRNFPFQEYANQYFDRKKKGLFGGQRDIMEFTVHSDKHLSQPLLELRDKNLIKDALYISKNILLFCGDKKGKSSETLYANVILGHILNTDKKLGSEIYAQLMKQSFENDNYNSLVRVFELFALLGGTLVPPEDIAPYVKTHLLESIHKGEQRIRELASYALLRMNQFASDAEAKRLEVPSFTEIEAVRCFQPVEVSISLIASTSVQMQVDCWTTIADVRRALEHRFQIKDGTPFTVFEVVNDDSERALEDSDRVLDLLAYWEREVETKRAIKGNKDIPEFRFVFKIRLFFDISEDDTSAVELAYLQAVYEVWDQRYPCSLEDCITLAALEAQEKFGDFRGEDVFGDKLAAYIPQKFYEEDEEQISRMKAQIYRQYQEYKGYDKLVCMINYLNYVKGWKYYGSQYFFANPVTIRLLGKEFPPLVIIGINAKGILMINPEGLSLIAEYPYSEIVTWGFSDNNFVFVVGNLVQSQKMYFNTDEGVEMNGLIHAYLNKLMEAQPEEDMYGNLQQQLGMNASSPGQNLDQHYSASAPTTAYGSPSQGFGSSFGQAQPNGAEYGQGFY
eukprot:maker-scaffold_15-snap-gene-8.0-mRNA-1 protein AED:0.13 eAED:0.13 QI:0/0.5/0.33/0.66/1/1/3/86/716